MSLLLWQHLRVNGLLLVDHVDWRHLYLKIGTGSIVDILDMLLYALKQLPMKLSYLVRDDTVPVAVLVGMFNCVNVKVLQKLVLEIVKYGTNINEHESSKALKEADNPVNLFTADVVTLSRSNYEHIPVPIPNIQSIIFSQPKLGHESLHPRSNLIYSCFQILNLQQGGLRRVALSSHY